MVDLASTDIINLASTDWSSTNLGSQGLVLHDPALERLSSFAQRVLKLVVHRGSSLIINSAPLVLYSRTMPRALWWSYRGGLFLVSEVPLCSTWASWVSSWMTEPSKGFRFSPTEC